MSRALVKADTVAPHTDTPMTSPGWGRVAVLQSFRQHDVPGWIARCLKSVQDWADLRGYDYLFQGDDLFALCGPAYLARAGGNIYQITDLARLEWTRRTLAQGYARAIWLDADVFIFDPARLMLNDQCGYAFGREVWMVRAPDGSPRVENSGLHNAAFMFTPGQADLDYMIATMRHIAMTRKVESNYQIGVRLISGLAVPLGIPVITGVGMFSPDLMRALVDKDRDFVGSFARAHGFPMQAGNLCFSKRHHFTEDMMMRAMDELVI